LRGVNLSYRFAVLSSAQRHKACAINAREQEQPTLEQQLGRSPDVCASYENLAEDYEPPEQLSAARHALTDAGNSLRFSEDHKDQLIFVKGLGWHIWDDRRWLPNNEAAHRAAKETARRIRFEAAAIQDPEGKKYSAVFAHAMKSESRPRLEAMVKLAERGEISSNDLVVPVGLLNTQSHLLNCLNGTVNLKTGKLMPHRKEDYITHLVEVEYDPKASAPRWERFVREVFKDDAALMEYVRRVCGYIVTGRNNEKFFVLAYGETDTGKSVFAETLGAVLGEQLARVALGETFVSSRHSDNGRRDLASLHGARLVRVPETEDGERLARQVVKRITGSDRIKAQAMYQMPFEYQPEFTILITTNHLPAVPHTDTAIWNRVRVVPFTQQFVHVKQGQKPPPGKLAMDKDLREKLQSERSGILAWLARGAYEWYRHGFGELPLVMVEAQFDYRASQDTIGRFLGDETQDISAATVLRSELYKAYTRWCDGEGIRKPVSARAFGEALEERGYPKGEVAVGRVFHGLKLV
jgi:putative DNA primase/helicase